MKRFLAENYIRIVDKILLRIIRFHSLVRDSDPDPHPDQNENVMDPEQCF